MRGHLTPTSLNAARSRRLNAGLNARRVSTGHSLNALERACMNSCLNAAKQLLVQVQAYKLGGLTSSATALIAATRSYEVTPVVIDLTRRGVGHPPRRAARARRISQGAWLLRPISLPHYLAVSSARSVWGWMEGRDMRSKEVNQALFAEFKKRGVEARRGSEDDAVRGRWINAKDFVLGGMTPEQAVDAVIKQETGRKVT